MSHVHHDKNSQIKFIFERRTHINTQNVETKHDTFYYIASFKKRFNLCNV